jgi:hypothetical protein
VVDFGVIVAATMSANHKPCEFAYWIPAFSIYPKLQKSI